MSFEARLKFVLVRPQMGENIGGAARAMLNFGLDRMVIVNPRDGWPNAKAVKMASGAGRVLDQAIVVDNVPAALGNSHYVLATTARPRGLTKEVLNPDAAMMEAIRRIRDGQRVAVLFGPERSGLENGEIARSNAIISVPVNPNFPSLNLAQCVLLCAYEWAQARENADMNARDADVSDLASQNDIEKLADHYEDRLNEFGFFFPDDKSHIMRINLRNMWSRMPMKQADVKMFHGILRQMVRGNSDKNENP
ncbi:MAG: RNA methyltransferase [Roseovarius sp.]|nr:RNA methyltransferase [Roseovarius sp.]MCY4206940.1 RNA methyltransferase [Roseovarius sp.]MCY4292874.1 RNA methyltransferase [Roseovarius sp.]